MGTNAVNNNSKKVWADRRHPLPSAALLRTQRATFTALGSSLHKGVLRYPPAIEADFAIHT